MAELPVPDGAAVLVVDDDPHVRQVVAWLLEMEGFRVEVAGDARQAVARGREVIPDLVVLDLNLPGATGETVARGLRSEVGPELAILVLSSDNDLEERAQSIRADGFLRKPFDIDDLANIARRLVARNGLRHAL